MNKHRIIITYQNHNYQAKVVEQRQFLFWTYWARVAHKAGPLRAIEPAIDNWCKEFNVNPKDVEDTTR